MAFIPKAPFPNVPQLPGVPQVARSNLFPAGPPAALNGVIALGRLALAVTTKPQWGIYKISKPEVATADAPVEGELDEVVIEPPAPPALLPDSFKRMDMAQEWDVSDAPVQEGGFSSYNKVNTPFEIKLRMTKSGSLASRQEYLNTLETISASSDLYRIVTPERVYLNCNITGYRVTREDNRAAYWLNEVELSFIEIRTVEAQYTSTASNTQNARDPSASPVKNQGTLNAVPPTTRVQTAVNAVLAPLRTLASILGAG